MTQKPTDPTVALRAMLARAMQAYELAQATRFQTIRRTQGKHERCLEELRARQETQVRELESEYGREETSASAEQERIGQLLVVIEDVEQAARDLLEKAGLAHIAGAPLQLGGTAAPVRRSDEAVTAAFVQAQTSYVDLRTALFRLAETQLEDGQWEATRRTLQPLLADQEAPLYADAHDLLCETHYRPALAALESSDWLVARQGMEAVLRIDSGYQDAAAQLRETYLRPAGLVMEAGQWEEARRYAEAWLSKQGDDKGAQSLLRDSYLRPAQQARDAGQWEAVRNHIEPWLKQSKDDNEACILLCESHYESAQAALKANEWEAAYHALEAALKLDAEYRDAVSLRTQAISQWLALDFVRIPAGQFLYGDNENKVHLDEYRISRTPVTNAQYQVYVKATGGRAPDHWAGGQVPKGKEQHPVVNVSWEDAQAFCRSAEVRLPSEREWEKAARGTDGRTYPWGDEPPDSKRCNFNNQVGDTTAVGSYPKGASPYGLLDMAGNVWEWCQDAHESGGRVLRGGAFDDDEYDVRCVYRYRNHPLYRINYFGFRVVAPSF